MDERHWDIEPIHLHCNREGRRGCYSMHQQHFHPVFLRVTFSIRQTNNQLPASPIFSQMYKRGEGDRARMANEPERDPLVSAGPCVGIVVILFPRGFSSFYFISFDLLSLFIFLPSLSQTTNKTDSCFFLRKTLCACRDCCCCRCCCSRCVFLSNTICWQEMDDRDLKDVSTSFYIARHNLL